jgi:hypothetical protein
VAVVTIILLSIIVILLGFILKVLFAINGNVLETADKVNAFEAAYQKHYADDKLIRKVTADSLRQISKNL